MEIEFRDGKVFKIYCKEGTVGIPQIVPAKESTQLPTTPDNTITKDDIERAWNNHVTPRSGKQIEEAKNSTAFEEFIKEVGL